MHTDIVKENVKNRGKNRSAQWHIENRQVKVEKNDKNEF